MRFLIVDDHPAVRIGIKHMLTLSRRQWNVDQAGTGRDALIMIAQQTYDAVILDLDLPDMFGLDVLKRIQQIASPPPVLIMSMYPEADYAIPALQAGGAGYLSKDSAESELMHALENILKGKKHVSPETAQRLAELVQTGANPLPHESLSAREMEVFTRLARGESAREIADTLGLSVKTVFTFRTRLLKKMDMETNADIIHYAIRHRLIS